MNDIMTRLGHEPLFFDGAMGTILQEKGLAPGEAPELWNLQRPKDVLAVHSAYLCAGADIISDTTLEIRGCDKRICANVPCGCRCRCRLCAY